MIIPELENDDKPELEPCFGNREYTKKDLSVIMSEHESESGQGTKANGDYSSGSDYEGDETLADGKLHSKSRKHKKRIKKEIKAQRKNSTTERVAQGSGCCSKDQKCTIF